MSDLQASLRTMTCRPFASRRYWPFMSGEERVDRRLRPLFRRRVRRPCVVVPDHDAAGPHQRPCVIGIRRDVVCACGCRRCRRDRTAAARPRAAAAPGRRHFGSSRRGRQTRQGCGRIAARSAAPRRRMVRRSDVRLRRRRCRCRRFCSRAGSSERRSRSGLPTIRSRAPTRRGRAAAPTPAPYGEMRGRPVGAEFAMAKPGAEAPLVELAGEPRRLADDGRRIVGRDRRERSGLAHAFASCGAAAGRACRSRRPASLRP